MWQILTKRIERNNNIYNSAVFMNLVASANAKWSLKILQVTNFDFINQKNS